VVLTHINSSTLGEIKMAFDVFEAYATDEKLEVEGTWIPHNGAKFKVARTGNSEYTKLINKEYEENRIALSQQGEEAEKLDVEIMIGVMARTILLGFEGVSYQGKEMKYSIENAKTLLRIKEFRAVVSAWAREINNYKFKKEEDEIKN
jgi:hypothetical protein